MTRKSRQAKRAAEHRHNVARLVARYRATTESERQLGREWYGAAYRACVRMAEGRNITVNQCAGAVAAMSPRMQWEANLNAAEQIISAAMRGEYPPPCGLGRNVAKAYDIAIGKSITDTLKGPKVNAFYRNIAEGGCGGIASRDMPMPALPQVTLDVWAMRAATGKTIEPKGAKYRQGIEWYSAAAEICGEFVAQFQAIIWTDIRGKAD